MDTQQTPRWQHSQHLQEWTSSYEWTFGVTVNPCVPRHTRRHGYELANRQQRILERALWGKKPPRKLVVLPVLEKAPDDGCWHSHWLVSAPKARQRERFESEGAWLLAKSCLAYQTRLPNEVLEERREFFVEQPAKDGGTVLTIPNDLHAPSIHWFTMDEIGEEEWIGYINKMRASDPDGDRFVFGRSVR